MTVELNTIKIKLDACYLRFDKMTQNIIDGLTRVISGGRIQETLNSHTYGVVTFAPDDKQCWYPTITLGDYNRLKTNAIVYNMKTNGLNRGFFDKCIIFHNNKSNSGIAMYGVIFLNSETGRTYQHIAIDDDPCEVIYAIQRDMNYFDDLDKHQYLKVKKI